MLYFRVQTIKWLNSSENKAVFVFVQQLHYKMNKNIETCKAQWFLLSNKGSKIIVSIFTIFFGTNDSTNLWQWKIDSVSCIQRKINVLFRIIIVRTVYSIKIYDCVIV